MGDIDFVAAPRIWPNGARNAIPAGFYHGLLVLSERRTTAFDLKFTVFRIPVRIHPMFWAVAVALGLRLPLLEHLIWVAVVFVSIMAHEMGHARALAHFRRPSRVVLYSFGGLTIPVHDGSSALTGWRPGFVSACGPLAGLGLAAGTYLLLPLIGSTTAGATGALYYHLIWINLAWGAMNMLPIWPLDGGQLARSVLVHLAGDKGHAIAATLSLVTSGAMAVLTWQMGFPLAAVFFGYFAVMEWRRSF